MGSLKWTREGGSSGPTQRQLSQPHHRQPSQHRSKLTWSRQPGSQQGQPVSASPGSEPLWPSDEPASPAAVSSLQPPLKRQRHASSGSDLTRTPLHSEATPQAQPSQPLPTFQPAAAASSAPSRGLPARHPQHAAHENSSGSNAMVNGKSQAASASLHAHNPRTAAEQILIQRNAHSVLPGQTIASGLPHCKSEGPSSSDPRSSPETASSYPTHSNLSSTRQQLLSQDAAGNSRAKPRGQNGMHQQQQQQQQLRGTISESKPQAGPVPASSGEGAPRSRPKQQHLQQQGGDSTSSTTQNQSTEQALKAQEQAAAAEARAMAQKAAAAARARQKQAELQALQQKLAVAEQRLARQQVRQSSARSHNPDSVDSPVHSA